VSSSPLGLLIEGEVDGPKPKWPATRAELLSKDHAEIWLAGESKLDLPPIGWGNQFGETDLKSESDCSNANGQRQLNIDACKGWFREQVKYREQFKRLFIRQWLLASDPGNYSPSVRTVEAYANAAMQNIAANFFPGVYAPTAFDPMSNDGVGMTVLQTGPNEPGYGFQIGIPYSAFPPMPSLDIRDLWIMVDVFSDAPDGKRMGAFSTSVLHRRFGDPSAFNHVQIEHPLQLQLTPCAYPLAQPDLYGKDQPAFVYPVPLGAREGEQVLIDKVVSVLNPAGGYL